MLLASETGMEDTDTRKAGHLKEVREFISILGRRSLLSPIPNTSVGVRVGLWSAGTRVSFKSQFIVDNKEDKHGITNNVIFFS